MASIPSVAYLKAANRFLHLAAAAHAEDEEERERAEEEEMTEEEEEESAAEPEDERTGKKGKKAKKPCRADDEPEEEDDEDASEEDDEDDEGKRKAIAAQARAAERARWAAVMSSKAAAGRIPLACSLLTDTSMSAEKVCAALACAPVEARQGLAQRMAAVPRPEVGSGPAATAPDQTTPQGRAASMRAAYDKALGRSPNAR